VEHRVNRSMDVYPVRIDSTNATLTQPTNQPRESKAHPPHEDLRRCVFKYSAPPKRRRPRGVWTGASGSLATRSSPRIGNGGVHRSEAFLFPTYSP